jgi:hypothetical protein
MPEAGRHGFSTSDEDFFTLILGAEVPKNKGLRPRAIHWSVKTLRTAVAP